MNVSHIIVELFAVMRRAFIVRYGEPAPFTGNAGIRPMIEQFEYG